MALDGTHDTAQWQGLLPGLVLPLGPGRQCWATSLSAAEPRLCPNRGSGPSPWWAPGDPSHLPPGRSRPGAWRFRTLRAVCSLFAEVSWPVFWFSYVLESHKLKTGHFPDLIQVTCRFFLRVCPCGRAVLRVTLCLCCCVWVSRPPWGPSRLAGFTATSKPLLFGR